MFIGVINVFLLQTEINPIDKVQIYEEKEKFIVTIGLVTSTPHIKIQTQKHSEYHGIHFTIMYVCIKLL